MAITSKTRVSLHERAHDCCEMCGVHGATNAHHRRNQSQGGHDLLSNLMLLCGSGTTGCHGFIGREPKVSEWMGWTIRDDTAPMHVEVFRFDVTLGRREFVKLADDGGIEYQEAA
jgi:hypothetical protein